MNFNEQSGSKDGVLLDFLTDEERGIRIAIARKGAEMIAFSRRQSDGSWRGFLYRDGDIRPPDQGWANHATVMGYHIHRLWKERTQYRGREIQGGTHGFIRHHLFDAPVRDKEGPGSLTYRLPTAEISTEDYPLQVGMELTYQLIDQGIRVTFAFFNDEPKLSAHVSFGLHPGFAVSDIKTCRILLPPGVYRRLYAPGNFLNGKEEKISFQGGEMPFPKSELPGSFLLDLSGVPDRRFVLEDPGMGRRVKLDFSEVPYLTIWSDLHPFICLEPCWGLPDANPPVPFEKKAGIQVIPPLGALKRGFSLYGSFLHA